MFSTKTEHFSSTVKTSKLAQGRSNLDSSRIEIYTLSTIFPRGKTMTMHKIKTFCKHQSFSTFLTQTRKQTFNKLKHFLFQKVIYINKTFELYNFDMIIKSFWSEIGTSLSLCKLYQFVSFCLETCCRDLAISIVRYDLK